MMVCCPTCQGRGEIPATGRLIEAEIEARTMALEAACRTIRARVTPEGLVKSKVAARLLDRAEGTLANWRNNGIGPVWEKRGQVYYSLSELARWQAISE